MQTAQLEQKLESLVNTPQTNQYTVPQWNQQQIPNYGMYPQQNIPQSEVGMFAEPNQNMFAANPLSLQVQSGNLLIMVLGAIMAGTIGGLVNRFFPIGSFAPVLAGVILRMVLKTGKGRDFANGVLIGGAASALSGIVGQFTGGLFGERKTSAPSRTSSTNLGGTRF